MAEHMFVTSPNFNDVPKISKETSPAASRARREKLSCIFLFFFFFFFVSRRKNTQQIVFFVYF